MGHYYSDSAPSCCSDPADWIAKNSVAVGYFKVGMLLLSSSSIFHAYEVEFLTDLFF